VDDSPKKEDSKDSAKTILIAEEEWGTRLLLKEELELEGYRVLATDSVSKAYKMIEEQMVDLYIVSSIYSSDGMNYRFKEQKPKLKIIIYSTHEKWTFLPDWANDFLIKSSDLTELIKGIKRLIG
jgi:DNA-binding NtrC family response regulator